MAIAVQFGWNPPVLVLNQLVSFDLLHDLTFNKNLDTKQFYKKNIYYKAFDLVYFKMNWQKLNFD